MDNSMEIAESARGEVRKRSFAGKLFMGQFDSSMILPYPYPNKNPEVETFINELMTYLKGNLDPNEVDASREIPKKVIKQMAKMGVFAMKIPKEYGGKGFTHTEYNQVMTAVAPYCGSTTVLISAHQSIGVPQPLKLYGTDAQKEKYFPRFCDGAISAFALTEVDVGSDPARMTTRAMKEGDHYILNGEKLWCTNGVIADVIVVMAKTGEKAISAFIVDMDMPGVEVVGRCDFMGLKGIYNGLLRFKDVKIPQENLIGEEGRGLAIALETINVGRLTLPAACTGIAKECLAICRKWGSERVQWGQPIGLHEAGREKIAEIASSTYAMEAVTWLCCAWADEGRDIRIEAAMAKMFCTEALWRITDLTMQLRGGRGYETASSLIARGEEGHPVERMMRDCRINTILEGSTEIMKLFLTREAIDPHFKRMKFLIKGKPTPGKLLSAALHYAVWYPPLWIKPLFATHRGHMRFIEKTAPRLARTLFGYMALYQKGLEHKQLLLGRLINIGTDLFMMAATLAYAGKEKSELADYFCKCARRRIKANFKALRSNDDKELRKIAEDFLTK